MPEIKVKAMAIVKRRDGALLASLGHDKVKGEGFARLLGGHVEHGEKAEDALRREFREELGCELDDVAHVSTIENIFTYLGEPGHEIVFLYTAKLRDASIYEKDNFPILDKPEALVTWISPDDVKVGKIKLYPEAALQI